jgi:outer membrane protein OmpA-like peptidoglycan-associated protein
MMMTTTKFSMLAALGVVSILSGCATNNELYAKYDKTCDTPKAKVKVVERVKYVDKVKVKYVDKVRVVNKVVNKGIDGLHWEPAVYFGFNRGELNAQEQHRLAQDAAILKHYPNMKVNIQAFTDVKGSTAYNRKLAVKRQRTVVNYLKLQGIASHRILVSPLGEDLPILGNSVSDRSINRRVELMLLDHTGRPMALKVRPNNTGFKAPYPVK